jgi:ubiquinone/menaquinone biosynthesis C-methylase UbiE
VKATAREIKKFYLIDQGRLLDIGCGNGFSTLHYAHMHPGLKILGIDFSEHMIRQADLAKAGAGAGNVTFEVGNVLELNQPDDSFDLVTTDRCLINLPRWEDQAQALGEIHRVLKAGGTYVMCEDTQEGLEKLNLLRRSQKLPEIPTRWHNLYLSEKRLTELYPKYFDLVEINNFSSLYYLASRVFNAKLSAMEGREPAYDHPINQIAAQLPSVGDYGPLKIFVFRKRP